MLPGQAPKFRVMCCASWSLSCASAERSPGLTMAELAVVCTKLLRRALPHDSPSFSFVKTSFSASFMCFNYCIDVVAEGSLVAA